MPVEHECGRICCDAVRERLTPGDLDLLVFDDLSARGHDALGRGDAAQAARLLSEALTLWQGDPAGDIALHGESIAVLEALGAAPPGGRRGPGRRPSRLRQRRRPGREAPQSGRRAATARTSPRSAHAGAVPGGRKAEALAEFSALRRRMVTDLGIEPSVPLQRLHRQIPARVVVRGPRELHQVFALPLQECRHASGRTRRAGLM